jgi:hypothetical protein
MVAAGGITGPGSIGGAAVAADQEVSA